MRPGSSADSSGGSISAAFFIYSSVAQPLLAVLFSCISQSIERKVAQGAEARTPAMSLLQRDSKTRGNANPSSHASNHGI